MNFLQNKDDEADALNIRLGEANLAQFQAKESLQRIAVFTILDDEGQQYIDFSQFYDLIRYAKIF